MVVVTVKSGAVAVRWVVENVPLIDDVVETLIEAESGSDTRGGVVMWSCERVVESSWEENDVRHHLYSTPSRSSEPLPGTRSWDNYVPAPIPIPDPIEIAAKLLPQCEV